MSYLRLHSNALRLLVGLDIDNSRGPLAGGDLALEQDVDLAVGSVLHLGQEEEGGEEADEAGAGPDITAPATEVGLLRYMLVTVHHKDRGEGGGGGLRRG